MKEKISKFFNEIERFSSETIEHEVVSGDNPWKLSMKYFGNPGMTDEIMDINGIKDPTKIQIGTVLKIPSRNIKPQAKDLSIKKDVDIKPFSNDESDAKSRIEKIDLNKRDLKNLAIKIAEQVGIPSDLFLGLVTVESNWNAKAKSASGAIGLTQLMPATARELGVSDPTNPSQNLIGGAKYLKKMLSKFSEHDDSEALALMAYHAGAGNVNKWISAGKPREGHAGVGKYTLSYPKKVFNASGR